MLAYLKQLRKDSEAFGHCSVFQGDVFGQYPHPETTSQNKHSALRRWGGFLILYLAVPGAA